jgi:hypothetical protein
MNSPERGALMLVRFVAVALLGWALVEVTLYVSVTLHKKLPVEMLPCLVKSLPAVAGVCVLVKARALSEWLVDKLDL